MLSGEGSSARKKWWILAFAGMTEVSVCFLIRGLKFRRSNMKKIILVIILLALCNTAVADKWWTGDAGNSNWFAPNNWTDGDSNAVPSNPENATVIVPYGLGTWPILNNGTADPNLCIVGGTGGHPARLVVATGGTLSPASDMWIGESDPCSAFDPCGIGIEVQITGGLIDIDTNLSIGKDANAKFAQSGGVVDVWEGTYVGQGTSLGTVEITGGDFETWNMYVHQSKFVIDGGDVVVGKEFFLAFDTNREPNVTELLMKSGTLTIGYANLAIGHQNIAKCVQTGGNIDVCLGTYLGACAGNEGISAYGIYELKGGQIDTWGAYIYHGKLIIDGGTMNVGLNLSMADVNNGEPNNLVDELQMKSGTLTVASTFAIGSFGEANCVMSGGNLFVGDSIFLGMAQSSVGHMEMSGGNLQAASIYVGGGWGDATQGFWDMTGGDITLWGDNDHGLIVSNQWVDPNDPNLDYVESVFTMDGGTINTPVLIVGRQGTGKFLMSDGTVNISDKLWIGIHDDPGEEFYTGVGEGLVELYGGQINVAVDVGCDIGLLKVG
jgi:hypothetical protein